MGEGEDGRRGVFDPGIHLAFMVWRRLSSPLNFVFRWREPERWEGDCGAGVRSPPPSGRHMCWGRKGEGSSVLWGEISKCHLMPRKKEIFSGMDISFVLNHFKSLSLPISAVPSLYVMCLCLYQQHRDSESMLPCMLRWFPSFTLYSLSVAQFESCLFSHPLSICSPLSEF